MKPLQSLASWAVVNWLAISVCAANPRGDALEAGCEPEQWEQIESLLYTRPARVDAELGTFLLPSDPRASPGLERPAASYVGRTFSMASATYRPLDGSMWVRIFQDPGGPGVANDLRELDSLLSARSRSACTKHLTALQKVFEQQAYFELRVALTLLQASELNELERVSRSLDRSIEVLLSELRFMAADFAEIRRLAAQNDPLLEVYHSFGIGLRTPPTAINISDTIGVGLHAQLTYAPCYFDSYAVIDQDSSVVELNEWLRFTHLTHQITYAQARPDPAAMQALPRKPPSNTLLMLVRRPLVLDESYRLQPIELVQRVSVRHYMRGPSGAETENYGLHELDMKRTAHDGRPHYNAVDMRSLAWGGLLGGAPDAMAFQGQTAVSQLNNNCAACHNFASPGAGDIFSNGGSSVAHSGQASSQSELTIAYFESARAPAHAGLLQTLRRSAQVKP